MSPPWTNANLVPNAKCCRPQGGSRGRKLCNEYCLQTSNSFDATLAAEQSKRLMLETSSILRHSLFQIAVLLTLQLSKQTPKRKRKPRQEGLAGQILVFLQERELSGRRNDLGSTIGRIDVPDQADARREIIVQLTIQFLGSIAGTQNLYCQIGSKSEHRPDGRDLPIPRTWRVVSASSQQDAA